MIKKLLIAAGAVLAMVLAGGAAAADQMKVIYHINEGLDQASNGLRNANNQLDVDPKAQIVFVAHSKGVDFLMKGAKDKRGNKFEDIVERLTLKGVKFEVCEKTLKSRKLSKDQFIEYASYVPSGVWEVTKLQQKEGFAYLKP
ncbi:MAG: DsrE family protein [Betaproteobacteria bacterium]|jgi:intracellular sulfur oxidation DsrE/DsrF family protein|nr:DsrE family protein [Betaproteobacteria bacterium]